MNPILVLTTASSREEATAIARALVTEKLAACINLFPVNSIYTWEGNIQTESEWQLVIKTAAPNFAAIADRIQTLHSYDVPEIIALPIVQGSAAYLGWMSEVLGP